MEVYKKAIACRRFWLVTKSYGQEQNHDVERTYFVGHCPGCLLCTCLPSCAFFVDQKLGVPSSYGMVANGAVVVE